MFSSRKLGLHFWEEAVNTATHILNMIVLRPAGINQTPYEIWKQKKPIVKYFRVFKSKCYILRKRENTHKFKSKSNKGIFLGYSYKSRAYRV